MVADFSRAAAAAAATLLVLLTQVCFKASRDIESFRHDQDYNEHVCGGKYSLIPATWDLDPQRPHGSAALAQKSHW